MIASGMQLFVFQMLSLIVISIFAMVKGGAPERCVAIVLLGMAVSDRIYHAVLGSVGQMVTLDVGHLVIDICSFAALVTIALKANRIWTLLAASTQMLSLMAHLPRYLDLEMHGLVYAVMTRAPSYLLIALLAIGTWKQMQKRVQF